MEFEVKTHEELVRDAEEARKELVKRALKGKARWGAWRYNPENLSVEIDSRLSKHPKDNTYYVSLEECNTSAQVLDWLCQMLHKSWCPVDQVGYLLKAIDDLVGRGGLQAVMCSFGRDRRFNMGKHLKGLAKEL